ncbi:MAG: hypothetical protein IPG73_01760 [Ignavibacteria bacterium]|nr:hypothetical protein [Ignavibacteria bacterium]
MQNLLRKYVPPSDRFAEILCGLIMLLTFTLAGGVMEASPDELVLGAVSCALAWGVIDGAIFMLNSLFQRGRQEKLVAEIRSLDRARLLPDSARDSITNIQGLSVPRCARRSITTL